MFIQGHSSHQRAGGRPGLQPALPLTHRLALAGAWLGGLREWVALGRARRTQARALK